VWWYVGKRLLQTIPVFLGATLIIYLLLSWIVAKLLHDPIRTLRESDSPHAPATAYLHAAPVVVDAGS